MSGMGGRDTGGMKGDFADREKPDFADGEKPAFTNNDMGNPDDEVNEEGSDTAVDRADTEIDYTAIDDIDRSGNTESVGVSISGNYETAQDYIDALNANGEWVTYDAETNTATITSIADFATAVKIASKGLGAFDQLDEGQGENTLFGYGDGSGAHFDSMLADILTSEGNEYAEDYSEDLIAEDALGHTAEERLNMYSPLYYLLESQEGYETSNVAEYFRINTGIWQSDTAVNTEANLALALENYGSDVEYSFVWGQGHTMAEESGDAVSNFIEWVTMCCEQE